MAKIEQLAGGAVKGSKDKKSGPRTLRRIEIEPAKNGYTVEERYDNDYDTMSGPSNMNKHVFEDAGSVIEYLEKCLGVDDNGENDEEAD